MLIVSKKKFSFTSWSIESERFELIIYVSRITFARRIKWFISKRVLICRCVVISRDETTRKNVKVDNDMIKFEIFQKYVMEFPDILFPMNWSEMKKWKIFADMTWGIMTDILFHDFISRHPMSRYHDIVWWFFSMKRSRSDPGSFICHDWYHIKWHGFIMIWYVLKSKGYILIWVDFEKILICCLEIFELW